MMRKKRLEERKKEYYKEFIIKLTPNDVLPGVKETLEDLRNKGIKMAIGASSKNIHVILK